MLSTLNEIKLGQKTQEQVNIKLDKTLDVIQKEREIDEKNKKENDKNIRDMKMWVLGLVGTIFGSLIIALLRMLMGI
ncbi:phage protein [Staphylococcus aureus DAR5801]|nr:phage protein [Staphylococcus aureus DAR5814]EXM93188.1 phage protein [Staphylococcus aureus DAR5801]EXM93346.1 phage protein [Staphylococcus aureus DAR5802]EXN26209.1 phage protein [Staphylococcus aureus DAR5816]